MNVKLNLLETTKLYDQKNSISPLLHKIISLGILAISCRIRAAVFLLDLALFEGTVILLF